MVEYMKQVAEQSSSDLSLEERNLLSVAYKNVVGARRASLRIIGSIETKEKEKGSANATLVSNYKSKVESELNTICQDILDLLDNSLITKANDSAEASVFYMKMKAGKRENALLPFPPSLSPPLASLLPARLTIFPNPLSPPLPQSSRDAPLLLLLWQTTTATSRSSPPATPRCRTPSRPRRRTSWRPTRPPSLPPPTRSASASPSTTRSSSTRYSKSQRR